MSDCDSSIGLQKVRKRRATLQLPHTLTLRHGPLMASATPGEGPTMQLPSIIRSAQPLLCAVTLEPKAGIPVCGRRVLLSYKASAVSRWTHKDLADLTSSSAAQHC